MTILFLTRRFHPDIGGVEKHVLEIAKRLVKLGHKIIVITEEVPISQSDATVIPAHAVIQKKNILNRRNDTRVRNDKINGIEITRIFVGKEDWFKKFRIWKSLLQTKKLIKKADVIHCHDVFFWYLPFRILYPRKPVFTTFHGYEGYPISRKAILIRKISEKLSWGNICIGDFIKKWYGTKPDFVSYGAVDIPQLSLRERSEAADVRSSPAGHSCTEHDNAGRSNLSQQLDYRAHPPGGFTRNDIEHSAIFIGRLDDQTGILTYNEAFKRLQKKYPKFELLIVGDGQYKKLLNKKTKVIGFQIEPEKYFQNHHFAFVSRYLSILEAMASKRLVFAVYDNPVKEDYLKMAPFSKFIIVETGPDKLSKKVIHYLNHPKEEKQLIDNAYNWVKKQSWDTVTELYLRLWREKLLK